MYLQTQNVKKLVNLSRYDYLALDGKDILAYRGSKYVILGTYEDEESALNEFCSLIAVLSKENGLNVVKMD